MIRANLMYTNCFMITDRAIETLLNLTVGGFTVVWIGIMVSAAASIPVVGFVVAIPAALVAYVVRAAATGQAQNRVERRIA